MAEKEYIEREAVLMLCQDFIDSHEDGSWRWVNAVTDKDIMNIPAADVVEVVRCKDCKYAHYWYGNDNIGNTKYLCHYIEYDIFYPDVFADDFCSRGERRE